MKVIWTSPENFDICCCEKKKRKRLTPPKNNPTCAKSELYMMLQNVRCLCNQTQTLLDSHSDFQVLYKYHC